MVIFLMVTYIYVRERLFPLWPAFGNSGREMADAAGRFVRYFFWVRELSRYLRHSPVCGPSIHIHNFWQWESNTVVHYLSQVSEDWGMCQPRASNMTNPRGSSASSILQCYFKLCTPTFADISYTFSGQWFQQGFWSILLYSLDFRYSSKRLVLRWLVLRWHSLFTQTVNIFAVAF